MIHLYLLFNFKGRLYDGHILDMIELGVDALKTLQETSIRAKAFGSKPFMVFLGDQWDSDSFYKKIENLLLGKYFSILY